MMKIERAQYSKPILPEHSGNPLIEALPPKKSWEEIMFHLSNYPDLAEEIANNPDPLVREEYLNRISELRQPLTEYKDCFRAVERVIKQGYSSRNPFSPTTAQYMHYDADNFPKVLPSTGAFVPKGEGLTLIGDSGVGKTTMIEQILSYFPAVIIHDNYLGSPVPFPQQVIWLKVDCPSNSSVRDLCEEILATLDLTLGREKTKPEQYIGSLIRQMEQQMKINNLGILVIDEMQNLQFSRTGGESNLLKFIHRLVNKLGIPIFFIANPPFDQSLIKELKAARRAESGFHREMHGLDISSQSWTIFAGQLWQYQWTNLFTELTEELNSCLHKLTCGNIDMAARTFREAQRLIIGSTDERITEASLEAGYNVACGLTRQTKEVVTFKASTALPSGPTRKPTQGNAQPQKIKVDKTGDVTKPQHSEFAMQLKTLLEDVDLLSKIPDVDRLQRIAQLPNALAILESDGTILTDPLFELD